MTAVAIVAVVVIVSMAVAGWLARRQRGEALAPAPWDIADAARRQITLLSGQAAVAITALVLLVTLVRDRSAVVTESFDTVVVMVLVAFLSFIGVAIQFVFLPLEGGVEGTLLPRFLFAISAIQHYRTLFLSWLALKPLVETFGLAGPASVLSWLLGAAAVGGWLIVASVCYRTGLVSAREAVGLPILGMAVALPLSFAVQIATAANGSAQVLALTLTVFVLGAVTLTMHALAPIAQRTVRGSRVIAAEARLYVVGDLQATVVTLALLWLALLRPL
jgi:hypothetical protein